MTIEQLKAKRASIQQALSGLTDKNDFTLKLHLDRALAEINRLIGELS